MYFCSWSILVLVSVRLKCMVVHAHSFPSYQLAWSPSCQQLVSNLITDIHHITTLKPVILVYSNCWYINITLHKICSWVMPLEPCQSLHNLTPVRSSQQWCHDDWSIVLAILRDCTTFIFSVKQFRIKEDFLQYLTLKMKSLSFETLETHHPTQHHIPQELNLQQESCYRNFQSQKKCLLQCLTSHITDPNIQSPSANNHLQADHTICKFQNRIPSIQQTT